MAIAGRNAGQLESALDCSGQDGRAEAVQGQTGHQDVLAADLVGHPPGDGREDQGDQGHRRQDQPRLDRGVAQHGLQVDGDRQEEAEDRDGDQCRDDVDHREVAVAEQRERHERLGVLAAALLQQEEHGQDGCGHEQGHDRAVPRVALTLDEGEGQTEQAGGGEGHADQVELVLALDPGVRNEGERHRQHDHPDRHVDDEDPPPAGVGHQHAAQRRAGNGGQAGDGAPDAQGGAASIGRERGDDDGHRLRHQHGCADALHGSEGDQQRRVGRQPAGQAGQGEDHDSADEQVALAAQVAQPAGGDQQHGQHQDVGVDHPEDLVERGVQGGDHARDGDVDDRQVEQGHEEPQGQGDQDRPRVPAPFADCLGHPHSRQDSCDGHDRRIPNGRVHRPRVRAGRRVIRPELYAALPTAALPGSRRAPCRRCRLLHDRL